MNKKQKGFTLVEMIIVTVIIGILAGIVITVINIPRVQAKSRDSKRIGDLKRIQTALELYFADNRGYPVRVSWVNVSDLTEIDSYIDPIPVDDRDSESIAESVKRCYGFATRGYKYGTNLTGGKYVLMAMMELPESAESSRCYDLSNCDPSSGLPCDTSIKSSVTHCYCVQNPM